MPTDPPEGFETRPLAMWAPSSGEIWLRLYPRAFPDPLGFGKTPSRFSDPRPIPEGERYGVVYLGSSLKVCVLEAIVRDRGDARLGDLVIDAGEIEATACAEIALESDLRLVDPRGDGLVRMGVPTDAARAREQGLGRRWALALHEHSLRPDGLIYPSRFTGEDNIALFDRGLEKVRAIHAAPLSERAAALAAVIRDLGLAIV